MGNGKISIIVPVYNCEKYLSKCLDSLLNQTYTNIEVICVNDGSRDNSLEILNMYAKRDGRIVIIDKKNEGVSKARTDALKISTGEYILFVDSDDWVDRDMCQIMLDTLTKNEADACMCCYVKEFGGHWEIESVFGHDLILDNDEFKKKFYRRLFGPYGEELRHPESLETIVSVWMQLFKAEYVRNIEFIDLSLIGTAEDLMFQIDAYKKCSRFVYIDNSLYHYRKDNETSITSTYKPELCRQREYMFNLMENIIKEDNLTDDYKTALENRIALSMIGIGLNESAAKKTFFEKSRRIKEILNSKRYADSFENLDFSYFPIHWKIFFKLCKWRLAMPFMLMINTIQFIRKR